MNDRETSVQEMKNLVEAFVSERDWQQFHSAKNIAMSIAVEAAELMELFQFVDRAGAKQVLAEHKQAVEEELVDVLSYVLSFAHFHDIDLSSALERKMAKNAEKYPVDTVKGKYTAKAISVRKRDKRSD